MKPVLILCLGNEVLSDDAVGAFIADRLQGERLDRKKIEITFAPIAGFRLLELLQQRTAVLIVDSIITGQSPPGTIHFMPAGHLTPSNGLINSHQISLPTALALGEQLGYNMPKTIDILAVEVQDIETLSEQLTEPVAEAVEAVIKSIKNWIKLIEKEVAYV